jgi:hypothetical protein
MTQQVAELYTALRKAGVDDDIAARAAKSVIAIEDKETLATKADLAELKADLTWRFIVVIGAQTAVFSAIVAALKFVKP